MPGPARFAAFLVVRFALAALLAAVARPVFADNERVIAVPAIRALAPEVSDDAARVTAEIRQRLKALPLLRIVDGPPVLSTYEDRVPQFEARLQEQVDLVLIEIGRAHV